MVETSQPAPSNTTPAAHGSSPVIACQGITKIFRDFWMRSRARAVDGLDMVIEQREVFGLLGPNGSGKSTTIKLILGLLRPTTGRIAVFGKHPSDVNTKHRIGYLPEESYLYQFLNARETLDYYAKLFEIDSRTRKKRIDELLDMVGLTHAQFRPVREYSKGMQRRIGLAQALINDPDLLILDEPTTGLDPIGTRQVKDLILELGRRGKTVLLSSHLLADVEDVVDRMVILYGGRARGEGTCDELLSSRNRTSIETDDLDDETISEIDRLIRARSDGNKSIRRVAKPRQKLEELFLGIVERAREDRIETSGAIEGGSTAAFLKGAAPADGADLIAKLMEDTPADEHTEFDPAPTTGEASDESESLIDSLVSGTNQNTPDRPPPEATPDAPRPDEHADEPQRGAGPDVDLGVIGSLLEPREDGDDNAGEKRP